MNEIPLYCRSCGKALSEQEQGPGKTQCAACTAAAPPPPPYDPSPYTAPTANNPNAPSPGLAFLLGLIPGVGAIYNGQYAKGLTHVFVMGLLASLADATRGPGEALFAMLIVAWVAYMAFEAYHTANKRALGLPVDEFSSLFQFKSNTLAVPVVLIGIGIVFLLNNFNLIPLHEIARFWPLIPIAAGVYMLYERLNTNERRNPPSEVGHEHRS